MRLRLAILTTVLCSASAAAATYGPVDSSSRLGWGVLLAQADTPLPVPDAQPGTDQQSDVQQPDAEQPPAQGNPDDNGTATEPTPDQPGTEDLTEPAPDEPTAGEDETGNPDELSLGEIPVIETMELTADIAKRALDSYLMVREKYQDSELDQYENLQDFVDQTEDGKSFEADIKAAGFDNVNDWNLAITTLSVAYSSAVDDPTAEIQQQIAEIEADPDLAQDMKDRMISSLKAMIPSENNKKVVAELMADPAYAEKLKQLDIVEE